jgi:hypothetical protein
MKKSTTREIKCKRCGNVFTSNKPFANCPDCREIIKKERQEKRKKELNRPCTSDTEYLVCVYTYRGDTPKRIAQDLDRSVKNIKGILKTAKESGNYDKHIKKYIRKGLP